MDIASILLARLTVLTPVEELNPGGRLAIPTITKGLVERYRFAKYPKSFDEWDETKGVEFVYGRWEQIEISKLTIYVNGIVIDTRTSTDDCEKILDDLYSWGTTILGLAAPRQYGSERRWYFSQLTFVSDVSLDLLHPALKRLANGVTAAVAGHHRHQIPYQTGGVVFAADEWDMKLPLGPFRVERREGVAFSENKYFSSGPLRTSDHIHLLREFEAALKTQE